MGPLRAELKVSAFVYNQLTAPAGNEPQGAYRIAGNAHTAVQGGDEVAVLLSAVRDDEVFRLNAFDLVGRHCQKSLLSVE